MRKATMAAILICCAGCPVRMTHARRGWQSCKAEGNVISCNGREMARVQCLVPADDACGALEIVYAGGEGVFLYRPADFDPDHPAFTGGGALHPEMASDGGLIWFRNGDIRSDVWQVYDPQSGVFQERDGMGVALLRDRGSVPLWGK